VLVSAGLPPVSARVVGKTDMYLGLEPVDELDNVRVLEALEHVELVKHHALVAADVPLQDDLDGDAAVRAVGLPDDAIGACAEGAPEAVLGSGWCCCWLAPDAAEGEGEGRGSGWWWRRPRTHFFS